METHLSWLGKNRGVSHCLSIIEQLKKSDWVEWNGIFSTHWGLMISYGLMELSLYLNQYWPIDNLDPQENISMKFYSKYI